MGKTFIMNEKGKGWSPKTTKRVFVVMNDRAAGLTGGLFVFPFFFELLKQLDRLDRATPREPPYSVNPELVPGMDIFFWAVDPGMDTSRCGNL